MKLSEKLGKQYKNVLLCGFMGAGKTYLLKKIKKGQKGINFVNLDDVILDKAQFNTTLKLMTALGEPHFRRVEEETLKELMEKGGNIISLGGGALNEGLRFAIDKRDDVLVIWLDVPFEQCLKNLEKDKKNVRPIAKKDDINLEDLYEQRGDLYKRASHVRIDWETLSGGLEYDRFIQIIESQLDQQSENQE